MQTLIFQGMKINIENPAGSVRSGIDKDGKPWSVQMAHAYGEIKGTMGVDGDPVDCFIGPNKHAKFAYVIHQTTKDGNRFDEDKVMLGFDDLMDAKEAYFKNFDKPEFFYGNIDTIPVKDFRKRVMEKSTPQMIRAMMNKPADGNPFKIGDPVTVDGFHGRGVVIAVKNRLVTIRFLSTEYITRDYKYVHNLNDRVKSTFRAAKLETDELESIPDHPFESGSKKIIVKQGTQFCVQTDGVDKSLGCYPSRRQAEAVMRGQSFIEPNINAANDDCQWITEKGQHICIKPGQTKSQAIKEHFDRFKYIDRVHKSATKLSRGALRTDTKLSSNDLKKFNIKIDPDASDADIDDITYNFYKGHEDSWGSPVNKDQVLQDFQRNFKMSPKDMEDILVHGMPSNIQKSTKLKITPLNRNATHWFISLKNDAMFMERQINLTKKTVEHVDWQIKSSKEGKGLGKQLFANQLDLYDHLGLRSVTLNANINVGGYAWARYGFIPARLYWNNLRNIIKGYFPGKTSFDDLPSGYKISKLDSTSLARLSRVVNDKNPKAIRMLAAFRDSDGNALGKALLLGSSWEGKLKLSGNSYKIARAYTSRGINASATATSAGPFEYKNGKKDDTDFHNELLDSDKGNALADKAAFRYAVRHGWDKEEAMKCFAPYLYHISDSRTLLAAKLVPQNLYAGGPGSGRHPEDVLEDHGWQKVKEGGDVGIYKHPALPGHKIAVNSNDGDWRSKTDEGNGGESLAKHLASIHAGGVGSGRHKEISNLHDAVIRARRNSDFQQKLGVPQYVNNQDYSNHYQKQKQILEKFIQHTERLIGQTKDVQQAKDSLRSANSNFGKTHIGMGHVKDGFKSLDDGLSKAKDRTKGERTIKSIDPKQLKLFGAGFNAPGASLYHKPTIKKINYGHPKVTKTKKMKAPKPNLGINMKQPNMPMHNGKGSGHRFSNPPLEVQADFGGEPVAGNMAHAHMDTNLWFTPPSLAKRGKGNHVPTDDPGEKDNKFLDVTKRNSKDTNKQRMKLLKRSAPGGAPAMIPVRTTLISPSMASYMPMNASALKGSRGRARRRSGGGMFLSYANRGRL